MRTRITCLLLAAVLLVLSASGLNAQEASTPAVINAPVGGSIAQIVTFYNQYANAVKAADRITVIKRDVREVDMEIPGVLRALMPRRMLDSPNQNITVTENFVNGEGTNDTSRKLIDFLPVNGKLFVSQLRASHVQSANCVRRGSGWVVTIMLKDEPLDTILNNSADFENMPEADRENFMNNLLLESGYGSSMELSSHNTPGRERPDTQRHPSNINRRSIKYDGGFQNGRIVAAFNQEGQLTSLTHSYNMNMNISVLLMKMKMNSSSLQEYQFIYPTN